MATAFPQDPHLTAIAIAYRNPDSALIADAVLPRAAVDSPAFQYTQFGDVNQAFTLPDTTVGPTGAVNRLEMGGTRVDSHTDDNALDIPLSFYDTSSSGANVKSRELATQLATSIIELRREVRTANLVFAAGTYPVGYKEQAAGVDQWNNGAYAGKVLNTIAAGLEVPLMRPNVLIFGGPAWTFFRQMPDVVAAIYKTGGNRGLVSRQAVADLFEVQEVLVGTGWLNTAKPGEAPVRVRAWGKHVSAIYRDRAAASVGGLSFGFTAEYGKRIAGSIEDKEMGLRGGERVRVGESTKELIVAQNAGYFWQDVIS